MKNGLSLALAAGIGLAGLTSCDGQSSSERQGNMTKRKIAEALSQYPEGVFMRGDGSSIPHPLSKEDTVGPHPISGLDGVIRENLRLRDSFKPSEPEGVVLPMPYFPDHGGRHVFLKTNIYTETCHEEAAGEVGPSGMIIKPAEVNEALIDEIVQALPQIDGEKLRSFISTHKEAKEIHIGVHLDTIRIHAGSNFIPAKLGLPVLIMYTYEGGEGGSTLISPETTEYTQYRDKIEGVLGSIEGVDVIRGELKDTDRMMSLDGWDKIGDQGIINCYQNLLVNDEKIKLPFVVRFQVDDHGNAYTLFSGLEPIGDVNFSLAKELISPRVFSQTSFPHQVMEAEATIRNALQN